MNKANPATLELLEKTLDTIASLLDGVNEVPANKNDAIVCSLDGTTFEIQRTIFCRICNVSFDFLKHFFLLESFLNDVKICLNNEKNFGE